MRKKILILTKSSKSRHSGDGWGVCVAGVSLEPGDNYEWIRLVADERGDSILDSQFPYEVLDVLDAELYPCQLNNQIENCQFEIHGKVGSKTILELQGIFDKMPHSFFGSMSESFVGDSPKNSLAIFFAKNLHIYREQKNNKQKVDFKMGNNFARGVSYTDYSKSYTRKYDPSFVTNIESAICVASLPSEPYEIDNKYHKFIASIFEVPSEKLSFGSDVIDLAGVPF